MKPSVYSALLVTVCLIAGIPATGVCMKKNQGRKAPVKQGRQIIQSKLTPIFAEGVTCTGIASPYGSTTRYDGSRRPNFRYNGRHGGIDLSLDPGTPLLAIASGTLVYKAEGTQMEGIFLWLLHTPKDTGYAKYVLTKYQHLKTMPTLKVGDRVAAGQVIGYSGATGTKGGHYGAKGYPHLHLSTMESDTGKFMIKDNALMSRAILFDPLILFKTKPDQTKVPIPFKDCSGNIHPKDAKVVWPVICFPPLPQKSPIPETN